MKKIILIIGLAMLYLPMRSIATVIIHSKILHVAKTGSDSNTGVLGNPLLTISRAEELARPGDQVIVHKGIYRETVNIHMGGTSSHTRITYKTAPGDEVIIKGSEQISNWRRIGEHTWRAEIDNKLYKETNPFMALVQDSSYQHLGEVYFQNKPLNEKKELDQVNRTNGTWFTTQESGKTIIIGNFGQGDPNLKLTEINVRSAAFTAIGHAVNYIVIDGFKISQIASPPASINGKQSGAITTNGGAYWLIQNCAISDCKSVAISIGQTGHAYPGSSPSKPEYSDLSQDILNVGHHIIRHNHIFRCGQAGVFGLLHGTCSQICDNLIEDINSDDSYPVLETAAIRLALAVDGIISHNLIRRVNGYGLFIGPLFQGLRISRNIITNTRQSCICLFNNHGPVLIDNNILSGTGSGPADGVKMISAEANVFVQNLFYNCGLVNSVIAGKAFATISFVAHSLVIKQTIPALSIDDRWYGNMFIKRGLDQLRVNTNCKAGYNVFMDGATGHSWDDQLNEKTTQTNSNFSLLNSGRGVSLKLNGIPLTKRTGPILTPEFIGFFALSKQYIEYPDGKPMIIDGDFWGKKAGSQLKPAGPFYSYREPYKYQVLFTY